MFHQFSLSCSIVLNMKSQENIVTKILIINKTALEFILYNTITTYVPAFSIVGNLN